MNKPHVFVVVYIGDTVCEAKLAAASADPEIVEYVVSRILKTDDDISSRGKSRRRNLRQALDKNDKP